MKLQLICERFGGVYSGQDILFVHAAVADSNIIRDVIQLIDSTYSDRVCDLVTHSVEVADDAKYVYLVQYLECLEKFPVQVNGVYIPHNIYNFKPFCVEVYTSGVDLRNKCEELHYFIGKHMDRIVDVKNEKIIDMATYDILKGIYIDEDGNSAKVVKLKIHTKDDVERIELQEFPDIPKYSTLYTRSGDLITERDLERKIESKPKINVRILTIES